MAQMTDEEKIAIIALMIGDVPGGPYFPMFTEDQYRQFLKMAKGDVNRATVFAAMSAAFQLSGESSREVIGELSISSTTSASYTKLLDYLISEVGKVPPASMMPWFAGMGKPDCNKLLDYNRCDSEYYADWTFGHGRPSPCGGC